MRVGQPNWTWASVGVHVLNRMLELGRPTYVRIPKPRQGWVTAPASLIRAICVDAPLGARRIIVLGAARRRVLTCVRPLMRRVPCRGPGWESADRVQIKAA